MMRLLGHQLLAIGSFDYVSIFVLRLIFISSAMLLTYEYTPKDRAPESPTLLKPGWMRMTGNLSSARKKKMPDPNASRSKRED